MENEKTSSRNDRHIGRKLWYGLAIGLSGLVLLLSVVGVLGTWTVGSALKDLSITLLGAVEGTAGALRQAGDRVSDGIGEAQQVASNVTAAGDQLSQNIQDQGLIVTLLPPAYDQKLDALTEQIHHTLDTIRGVLTSAQEMYRSIDRLPFISLPRPSHETIDRLNQAATNVQVTLIELRQTIQGFRSGVSGQVDRLTGAAERVTQGLDELQSRLEKLDSELATLQDAVARLQELVPLLFGIVIVLFTLFFVFVIYTQFEFMRLVVGRWRGLSAAAGALPGGEPAPTGELETGAGSEPAAEEAAGDEPAADETAGDEPEADEAAGAASEPSGDEPLADEAAGPEEPES